MYLELNSYTTLELIDLNILYIILCFYYSYRYSLVIVYLLILLDLFILLLDCDEFIRVVRCLIYSDIGGKYKYLHTLYLLLLFESKSSLIYYYRGLLCIKIGYDTHNNDYVFKYMMLCYCFSSIL